MTTSEHLNDAYNPNGAKYEDCKDCFKSARLVDDWGRCGECANMCNRCGEYVDYDLDGDLRCEMCPIETYPY